MGNVHALAHRVTALSMACLSSAALILCAIAGFGCNYVSVNALPMRNVMTPAGQEFVGVLSMDIGVLCDSPFYEDWDRMWNMSQIFFWISVALGSLTTLVAWSLGLCVPPTAFTWRAMSLLAAATAVMEVPIFLIFESEPCNMDISRQTCSLSVGAYFNMVSVVFWVAMTLWTQLKDPPNWSREIEAWRSTTKGPLREIAIPSSGSTEDDCSPAQADKPEKADGDLYVTSSDIKMALWSMGDKPEKDDNNDDHKSDISSISAPDLESGIISQPKLIAIAERELSSSQKSDPPNIIFSEAKPDGAQNETHTKSRSYEARDSAIRKGAALVRSSFAGKEMSPIVQRMRSMTTETRYGVDVEKPPQEQQNQSTPKKSGDRSATASPSGSKAGTPSTADTTKASPRDRPLMDDDSAATDVQPGCQISVTLPDGTQKVANLAACFLPDNPCDVMTGGCAARDTLDTPPDIVQDRTMS